MADEEMLSQVYVPFEKSCRCMRYSPLIRATIKEVQNLIKHDLGVVEQDKYLFLDVPVGVEAVDEDRNVLLARCNKPFYTYLIARGGCGGDARNNFKGERGEQLNVSLHLKLRPNVGLVGFPNAGKSTLMKAFVPRKSIKIAPYPFTTTKPQVAFWTVDKGKKELENDFTLSFADLPGLIEGASQNRGKGYKFLKHLEYSDILLLVVDCMGFQLSNNLNEPFSRSVESLAGGAAAARTEPEKLVEKMSGMDWPRHVPEHYRPAMPLIFDYVLPVSAKLGDVEEVKKALVQCLPTSPPYVPTDSHNAEVDIRTYLERSKWQNESSKRRNGLYAAMENNLRSTEFFICKGYSQ
ncbi:Obg family GTPase CgtA [Teladorsagia circumcincta]|uniref:Obg family GTPase CgtA n=1 Tax=Teladorsagia circumcincta TaxID=45464 RepID=A0A2G9UDY6_TELCI|nr:Obg family GTPase CgtA [Teladorsagia circumcincta]